MGVVIRNMDTGQVVLQARLCTSFFDTYVQTSGPVRIVDVPLSFYDAVISGEECFTDVLVPSDEERFNGKVALFMESNAHCHNAYYDNMSTVKRVQQAGGIGILYLNRDPSSPGVWHDFDKTGNAEVYQNWYQEMGFNESLPVMQCGHDIADQNITELIPAWIDAMHQIPANAIPTSPYFNQTLSVSITEDPNYWILDLQTGVNVYFVIMKVLFPILSFGIALVATRTILQRYRVLNSWFTMQNIALAIEVVSMIFLGVYFAVDGYYATPNSAFVQLRMSMGGGLVFLSTATTLIVGLNFAVIRRWITKMESVRVSFAEKFKWAILSIAVIFVGFEILGDVFRRISWEVTLYFNFFVLFVLLTCVFWFAWEVKSFVRVISDENTAKTSDLVNKLVVHNIRWTIHLIISNLGLLTCYVLSVQGSKIFTPPMWKILAPLIWGCRLATSLSKVFLLKPLPRKNSAAPRTKKSTIMKWNRHSTNDIAVAPFSVAAGAESAIVSSVTES